MNTMRQTNRDGGEYIFDRVSNSVYELVPTNEKMEKCLKVMRFSPKANSFKYNDLNFIDPMGGPFISIGFPIIDKKVKKISIEKHDNNERILFEVE